MKMVQLQLFYYFNYSPDFNHNPVILGIIQDMQWKVEDPKGSNFKHFILLAIYYKGEDTH